MVVDVFVGRPDRVDKDAAVIDKVEFPKSHECSRRVIIVYSRVEVIWLSLVVYSGVLE
jgi:hypothetical protein